MAYNFNKGNTIVTEVVSQDDSNRDTKIDFGDNQINLLTAGSTVISVKTSTVEITGSLSTTSAITSSNLTIGTINTSNISLGGMLFSNKSGSATNQASNPIGLFFKSDGTVAYVADITTNKIFQYSLSSAWDVSTISYANKTASVLAEDTTLQDIFIHPDGNYLYAIGQTGDDINQYTLSTPWDISTATFFGSSSVNGYENTPTALFFKPDGKSVFIVGTTTDTVRQHTLGTAWDVRTMSTSVLNSYSVTGQESLPSGISFTSDGKKMFMVGSTTGARSVYEYLLPTAWDLNTISKVVPHDISSNGVLSNAAITALYLRSDGTNIYFINNAGDTIVQYQTVTSSVQTYNGSIQAIEGITSFGAVAAPSLSSNTLKSISGLFGTISATSTISTVGGVVATSGILAGSSISGSSTILAGSAITGSGGLSISGAPASFSATSPITASGGISLAGSSLETSWTSYSVQWTTQAAPQPVIGNGTLVGYYKQIGKTVFVRVKMTAGTTTTFGTGPFLFSLPVSASNADGIQFPCSMLDNGFAWYQGIINGTYSGFTEKAAIIALSPGGYNSSEAVTSVHPFTWGSTDSLMFNGSYESI